MSSSSKEIFRGFDEYGPVQVLDDGNQRRLAFGEGDHQSCMLKAAPTQLHYDYTRAMVLALLLNPSAKRALLLGLGAGSLAGFLHQHSQLQLTAVELPRSERLEVINENALHYLQRSEPNDFDFIFSDIYTGNGVDDLQLQESYLDMCRECLNDQGWLILNCWREHQTDRDLIEILRSGFSQLYSCTTQSGNWILFAGNSPLPGQKPLQRAAKNLSMRAGFSLQGVIKKLHRL
jgi:spermidine synthase